jgi:hypothetical protein
MPVAHEDEKRQDDIQWIDFRHNEIQDDAYTPADDNIRGPYLPDQVDQVDRAAEDDAFHTAGETGLAEGGGSYGEVGAGTSGGMASGRGDTGRFGTMGGTDLSDTLGGEGGPDQTAGPVGTESIGDLATPEVAGERQAAERAEQPDES